MTRRLASSRLLLVATLAGAACAPTADELAGGGHTADPGAIVARPGGSGRCASHGATVARIAEGMPGPLAIAVDAQALYVGDSKVDGEGLLRIAKDGSSRTRLAPNGCAGAIDLDDDYVYAAGYDNMGPVCRVRKEGGPYELLATGRRITDLAVSGADVFWIATGDESLMRMPNTGGTPTPVAAPVVELVALAVAGEYVYWAHRTGDAAEVARSQLVRTARRGGAATVVFEGSNVSAVATDDEWVYFSAAGDTGVYPDAIWRARHDGERAPEIIASAPTPAWHLKVDGPCVYFMGSGGVFRVDVEGGEPAELAPLFLTGARLAIDEAQVYVSDYQGGIVWAIPK